ncbi:MULTISPECIES: DUF2076 family protein [unclassified Undibacterium]|uniref:DUF2076 family protein n=1 Tax=unclassified Undibacterium TaxID=2630295 RepID=UPI002AC97F49|nr:MULTISPECIES: DUF2076 family protein [unclassified Undibacterium]MEB0140604.1 DUF2076 family protein [Undibacterium sp. CCC2.1]MEB0173490.1 DUF2076 family protein [Undibacterium sp. CCC1.1]MEB0177608.1 DUF2076 family protein [Undibacterium sp. CCC3.4]MEB0216782.1 DUF2076 family protein [Undibacterium sp. 5I2]WPX44668.1 DUF2076 family protein [Undibacterium sp. CCC3.4]
MSPQEIQVLQNFLDQLVQVQGVHKDGQAQDMINAAVNRQPDAAYLLVQRALLLDQAVAQAGQQLAAVQAELRAQTALVATLSSAASSAGTAFLDPAASDWGNSSHARPLAPAMATAVSGAPLPAMNASYNTSAAPPVYSQAAPAAGGFFSGNGGSMLGTVAATAASVAAGAFLYQGISHMMGGNSASGLGNAAAPLANTDNNLSSGYFDSEQSAASPLESADEVDDLS